jgi:hypothetical protein
MAALRFLPPTDPLLAALTDAVPGAPGVTLARTKLGVRVEGPASQVPLARGAVSDRVQALAGKILVHSIPGSDDMEARHLQASAGVGKRDVGRGVGGSLPHLAPCGVQYAVSKSACSRTSG